MVNVKSLSRDLVIDDRLIVTNFIPRALVVLNRSAVKVFLKFWRDISISMSSSTSSPKKAFIGYVHRLSFLRRGRKCPWFDMELQGADNVRVRAVCLSRDYIQSRAADQEYRGLVEKCCKLDKLMWTADVQLVYILL